MFDGSTAHGGSEPRGVDATLNAMLAAVRGFRTVVENLDVGDAESRSELCEALSLAEIALLRLKAEAST